MTLPGLPGGAPLRTTLEDLTPYDVTLTVPHGSPRPSLAALKHLVSQAQARLERDHGPLLYGLPVVTSSACPDDTVLVIAHDLKGIGDLAVLTGGRTAVYKAIGRDGHPSKLHRALNPVPFYTTRCAGMLELARDRRRRRKGLA